MPIRIPVRNVFELPRVRKQRPVLVQTCKKAQRDELLEALEAILNGFSDAEVLGEENWKLAHAAIAKVKGTK